MVELDGPPPGLRTVAVTGTNGKSTTTAMVASVVACAGEPEAAVTTIGAWVAGEDVGQGPGLDVFVCAVKRALEVGVRTFALETTSKALSQGFAHRWPADVAVFTNLSRDHLDYHHTVEQYLASKAQLFLTLLPTGACVFNASDPSSALLHEVAPPQARRFGFARRSGSDPACDQIPVDLQIDRVHVDRRGTKVILTDSALAAGLGGELQLSVLGAVHAENALAAALGCHALGYEASAIKKGLEAFRGLSGRFEVVSASPWIVVDYAHTPEALAHTLQQARELAEPLAGRVLCVFGCGGERDTGKRSMMGQHAARLADWVVVTSDNPRSEDPCTIIEQVLEGAREQQGEDDSGSQRTLLGEIDRSKAIQMAVASAVSDDVVVIAGKGHERVQVIGETERPWSDVEEVRTAVAACTEDER